MILNCSSKLRKKSFEFYVSDILNNIRDEDFEELFALFGDNWKEISKNNILNTDFKVLLIKNCAIAMGGISNIDKSDKNCAIVWLLTRKNIKKYSYELMKALRCEILNSKNKYKFLYNKIYYKNFEAKNWLLKLGFKFDNTKPKHLEIPDNFEFFYKINT